MTIEDKAVECYEKNRKLKPKYHIDDEAWMDWFEEGYKRAQADQPKIKPLEFKDGIAITPIGQYEIILNDQTLLYSSQSPTNESIISPTKGLAIEACNIHYRDLIMSCFTNTEDYE